MREVHKVYRCNHCEDDGSCYMTVLFYVEDGPEFCPYGGDFEANWVFSGISDKVKVRQSSVDARGVETSR